MQQTRRGVPSHIERMLKDAASERIYCGHRFNGQGYGKSIDHMEPDLPDDGYRNLVVSCMTGNTRKHHKPFAEWIQSLPKDYAKRSACRYAARYGELPWPRHLVQAPLFRQTGYLPREDGECEDSVLTAFRNPYHGPGWFKRA